MLQLLNSLKNEKHYVRDRNYCPYTSTLQASQKDYLKINLTSCLSREDVTVRRILLLHVVLLSFICPGESANCLCSTITFVQIDLHIHRQQEQVFDVFFCQGAARLDCSRKEDELGWRRQQGRALTKQECSHTFLFDSHVA